MLSKRLLLVVGVILVASMVLSACAPAATTAPTEAPKPTDVPMPTDAPTAAPTEPPVPPTTRHGGWLDEIDYSVVDAQSAITQIGAGAVDLFSYGLAADKLAEIKAAGLCYTQSYGTYYDMIYNPAVFTDDTSSEPLLESQDPRSDQLADRPQLHQPGSLCRWCSAQILPADHPTGGLHQRNRSCPRSRSLLCLQLR